jgi:hypothetical protein
MHQPPPIRIERPPSPRDQAACLQAVNLAQYNYICCTVQLAYDFLRYIDVEKWNKIYKPFYAPARTKPFYAPARTPTQVTDSWCAQVADSWCALLELQKNDKHYFNHIVDAHSIVYGNRNVRAPHAMFALVGVVDFVAVAVMIGLIVGGVISISAFVALPQVAITCAIAIAIAIGCAYTEVHTARHLALHDHLKNDIKPLVGSIDKSLAQVGVIHLTKPTDDSSHSIKQSLKNVSDGSKITPALTDGLAQARDKLNKLKQGLIKKNATIQKDLKSLESSWYMRFFGRQNVKDQLELCIDYRS